MRRGKKGNAIILSLALLTGLALVLGFFGMNFLSTVGTERQAKTAAEAAALQAAKDLSQVAIATPLGQIGTVDFPANSADHPARNLQINGQRIQSLRVSEPVMGVNTLVATLRLNLLMASDMRCRSLQDMVASEVDQVQRRIIPQLNQAIRQAARRGGPIFSNALQVYSVNALQMQQGKLKPGTFRLAVGALTAGGATNIPVPSPADSAARNESINGFYKPYVSVPVSGSSGNVGFVLSAVGQKARLVDPRDFSARLTAAGSVVAATVARVDADNDVSGPAPQGGAKPQAMIHTSGCAQIGGNVLVTNTSTLLTIGFAGGLPPRSAFNNRLTVVNMLNSNLWVDPRGTQTWFVAKNGDTPNASSSNVLAASNGVSPAIDPEIAPATEGVPQAMARGIAHWWLTLGLRPDRSSMVQQLTAFDFSRNASFPTQTIGGRDVRFATCMLSFNQAPNSDQRYLSITRGGVDFATAYFKAFGYTWAALACPRNASLVVYDEETGEWTLPDGSLLEVACDAREAAIQTNSASILAGSAAFLLGANGDDDDDDDDAALARAAIVRGNADRVGQLAGAINNNFGAISAGGVRRLTDGSFAFPAAGVSFRPATLFANARPVPKCRFPVLGSAEMAQAMAAIANPFVFLRSGSNAPWDGAMIAGGAGVVTGLASPFRPSNIIPNKDGVLFYFYVNGDASQGTGGGQIVVHNPTFQPTSPAYAFQENKLRNGQYLFVETNGLKTVSRSGNSVTCWSIIARHQTADLTPALGPHAVQGAPSGVASYCQDSRFIDTSTFGPGECPREAFHIRIGCPMPVSCCDVICPDTPGSRCPAILPAHW